MFKVLLCLLFHAVWAMEEEVEIDSEKVKFAFAAPRSTESIDDFDIKKALETNLEINVECLFVQWNYGLFKQENVDKYFYYICSKEKFSTYNTFDFYHVFNDINDKVSKIKLIDEPCPALSYLALKIDFSKDLKEQKVLKDSISRFFIYKQDNYLEFYYIKQ